jgi:hypothetical protein
MADAVGKRSTSAYRARFAVAYALVGAVFVGVIALFMFLVSQNSGPEVRWSGYEPKGSGMERAQAIANHVAPRYREGGQIMAAVNAQPPVINAADVNAFALARASTSRVGGGIEKVEPADDSIFYVFCGSGQRCAIPGEPTPERALLLRRQSLELALYTFKYMEEVDSVITLMPPVGKVIPAGYFKRSAVRGLLDKPLFETLPARGPFDTAGANFGDVATSERFTAGRFYQSDVQELPSGGALLVLTQPPLTQPAG